MSAIQALMNKSGIPAAFTHNPWRPEIEWKLGPNYPLKNYQHIMQDGFYGDSVDVNNPMLPEPLRDVSEVIALLGHLLAGVKAAAECLLQ